MLVDFQDAKLIESKIKEKGVVLYTENIDNIFGTHYIKYLYSDNKTKEIHIDTMLFYTYYNDNDKEKLIIIPKEEVGNFEYLMLTIQLYLSSQKYKNIAYNMSHYDGDGTSRIGWELGCYDMYHDYLMEQFNKMEDTKDKYSYYPDYDHYACLYLKPYWTFYHK